MCNGAAKRMVRLYDLCMSMAGKEGFMNMMETEIFCFIHCLCILFMNEVTTTRIHSFQIFWPAVEIIQACLGLFCHVVHTSFAFKLSLKDFFHHNLFNWNSQPIFPFLVWLLRPWLVYEYHRDGPERSFMCSRKTRYIYGAFGHTLRSLYARVSTKNE